MSLLNRYSFRQLLLVAFLLIAALLGAASLRGLFTLEGLLLQSGAGARAAVAETAARSERSGILRNLPRIGLRRRRSPSRRSRCPFRDR